MAYTIHVGKAGGAKLATTVGTNPRLRKQRGSANVCAVDDLASSPRTAQG